MKTYCRCLNAEFGLLSLRAQEWKIGRILELNDPSDCRPLLRRAKHPQACSNATMRLFIAILMMLAGCVANAADLYSISPGRIDNPDIVWSRNIPVVGQEITISARVRGLGKQPVAVRLM